MTTLHNRVKSNTLAANDNLSILVVTDYSRILRGMHDRKGRKGKGKRGVCNKDANRVIVQPLKRHITQERKQLESLIYGLRTKLYLDVEKAINVILEKIRETEHSVELIAQELNRRGSKHRKSDRDDAAHD